MKIDQEKRIAFFETNCEQRLATACLRFVKYYYVFFLLCAFSSLSRTQYGTMAHFFGMFFFPDVVVVVDNIHFPRVNIVTDMVKIILGDYSDCSLYINVQYIRIRLYIYIHWSEIRYVLCITLYQTEKKEEEEDENCAMSQWWG